MKKFGPNIYLTITVTLITIFLLAFFLIVLSVLMIHITSLTVFLWSFGSIIVITLLLYLILWLLEPTKEKSDLDKAVSRMFHHSFDDIDWKYEWLNEVEKRKITPKEFEEIKQKYF